MMKYLLKRQVKKQTQDNGKRALIYGGAVLTGVGAYYSYKAVKNYKLNKHFENGTNLEDSEYEMYNYDNEQEDELQDKVKEFNSRRINWDNCAHVSKNDLESYVKESEQYKEKEDDIVLDENAYKEEEYDKYEYYEDDLLKH